MTSGFVLTTTPESNLLAEIGEKENPKEKLPQAESENRVDPFVKETSRHLDSKPTTINNLEVIKEYDNKV